MQMNHTKCGPLKSLFKKEQNKSPGQAAQVVEALSRTPKKNKTKALVLQIVFNTITLTQMRGKYLSSKTTFKT